MLLIWDIVALPVSKQEGLPSLVHGVYYSSDINDVFF